MFDNIPGAAEVHLWLLHLNFSAPLPERLVALLDTGEAERAERFRFAVDRYRYTACRAMLRFALGRYLHVDPHSIRFSATEYGKPFLASPLGAQISFNVSHSGTLGALAFSAIEPVGVDVETLRPEVDVLGLATACLSEAEIAHLWSHEARDQTAVFYRYWTGKEAWIKADGRGLSLLLREHTLRLVSNPGQGTAYYVSPPQTKPWIIRPVDTPAGYDGAIACPGEWTLRRVDLDPAVVSL